MFTFVGIHFSFFEGDSHRKISMKIFVRESIYACKQTGFEKNPLKGSHGHSQMHVDVNICRLYGFSLQWY